MPKLLLLFFFFPYTSSGATKERNLWSIKYCNDIDHEDELWYRKRLPNQKIIGTLAAQ